MKLSILIPVYNEAATIARLLEKVFEVRINRINKEIVVIDDGSTDETPQILEKYNGKIKILRHDLNKGKGSAIRTGLKETTGDLVIIQDADLEYDPNDFNKLVEPIVNNKADVVFGSRNLTSNRRSGNTYYIGGVFLTFLANLLYGTNITDESTCYKLFKASILKSLNLKCKRFEFCPEVIAKIAKRKCHIIEVPISYQPRTVAEGKKINWLDGLQAISTLIKYKFFD